MTEAERNRNCVYYNQQPAMPISRRESLKSLIALKPDLGRADLQLHAKPDGSPRNQDLAMLTPVNEE